MKSTRQGRNSRGLLLGQDEPEASAEEASSAEDLRLRLERGGEPLAELLRAAHCPAPIARNDAEAVLGRAFGDESSATELEIRAASELCRELSRERALGPSYVLQLIHAATNPPSINPERNDALIANALAQRSVPRAFPLRPAIRIGGRAVVGVAAVMALAASVALFLDLPSSRTTRAPQAQLARVRSADDVFDAAIPFPRSGEESGRVDRIAAVRGSELRRNRFAQWGVR